MTKALQSDAEGKQNADRNNPLFHRDKQKNITEKEISQGTSRGGFVNSRPKLHLSAKILFSKTESTSKQRLQNFGTEQQ
jgi:hypothetical protein